MIKRIIFLMVLATWSALAQNSNVTWYSFSAGFEVPVSSVTSVKSSVGQSVVGRGQLANTVIESGFLADTLFRRFLTSVGGPPEMPTVYELRQNYPNPFNPSTTIAYALPRQSRVVLTIYNILGQEVVRLLDETQEPGTKSVMWNGRDAAGSSVSSGVYFYRLEAAAGESAERFVQVLKLMLLK